MMMMEALQLCWLRTYECKTSQVDRTGENLHTFFTNQNLCGNREWIERIRSHVRVFTAVGAYCDVVETAKI